MAERPWAERAPSIPPNGAARPAEEACDALARSEERYRTLFEAIDDGFCIIET